MINFLKEICLGFGCRIFLANKNNPKMDIVLSSFSDTVLPAIHFITINLGHALQLFRQLNTNNSA